MAVVRLSNGYLQTKFASGVCVVEQVSWVQRSLLPMLAMFLVVASSVARSQVSCTGLCLQQVSCGGGGTTSISGTVYAPNGTDPLPNVLVYIPNAAVGAFPQGVQCLPNGQPALGSPLVSTTTAINGTFTLNNVPVGSNIPLVIQAGKWRRQFVVPSTTSCGNTLATTAVPAGQVIRLPKNKAEGDIPQIAVVTGSVDGLECVLNKIGVDTSEFTDPSGSGRINLYLGDATPGARIDVGTPRESVMESSASTLARYDLVMLACQGQENPSIPSSYLSNVASYANSGGRIFATHYSYDFLYNNPAFAGTVQWSLNQGTPTNQLAFVNQSIPQGAQLAQWLQLTGASTTLGQVPVQNLRKDQNGVIAPTQSFLSINNTPESIQFTFGTPVGSPAANQCGRVLFNEYHVEDLTSNPSSGKTFPTECTVGALTPQEKLLEYSFFDLGSFVSASPSPTVSIDFTNTPATLQTGDSADTVAVNVSNTSTTTATNATLTVALTLPAGLTATAIAPAIPATSGWTCTLGTLTCTRTTGLDAQASDAIVVTFGVSSAAASPLSLSATVANGNLAASVTASDPLPLLLVPTVSWPTPAAIVYGTPLSGIQLDATASYGGNPVAGSFAYTPAAGAVLNAGLQTLSTAFTPTDPTVYASANQMVGLQVNQGTPVVTLFAPANFTYGAASVSLSAGLSWSGPAVPTGAFTFSIDGSTVVPATCTSSGSCSASYNSATLSAGTHTLSASIGGDINYTSASSSMIQFNVSPATLMVTAGSYSGVYDGGTHALSGCVVSSNPDGLTCTNNPVGPVGPDVGGSSVTPVVSGPTANYNVTAINGSWSITPKSVTLTAGSYSGNYDGSAHGLSACTSSYAGVGCANSPASVGPGTGGGTVLPVASYLSGVAGDYAITAQNGSWSIAQVGSVTTVSCPAGVTYNGTAQTPCTANVTGAGGLNQAVAVSYSLNTNVGVAVASATFAGDANHTGSSDSKSFNITAAPLTLTAGSYSGVYDGNVHALSACVVSSNPDGLTCSNNPVGPVGPDVGGAAVLPVPSGAVGNYSVTSNNGSWSITPRSVTLTAGSYSGAYDGSAHSPSTCTSSYAGLTCANSPVSVGPGAGSGAVTAVPSYGTGSAVDFAVTSVAGAYSITKLAASVTPNAAMKVYGTADPVLTGTLSGFVPADGVTATYVRTAGETVAGSPYTISATLSPSAALSNYVVTSNTASFTITKANPVLNWTNPAAIGYGTPLSATQLNATANLTGGTFGYTPSAGTVPGVGSQSLSVLYTPTDTADYNTATASVTLTVNQATPVVTWANPPSIVYGTGTGAAQKTATATGVGGVSLPGSYFYTTPDGTVFGVGTHPLGVAFTPTDSTDYAPVSAFATLTVTKGTPTVTWATPASITYGTALSGAQLNATASVAGTFVYTPTAGAVLHAGAQTLSVTFTPNDTADYGPVTTSVPLTVNKATPVITWPTPASITYGTPLSATQLNATANVAGTFAYTASTGPNPLGVLLPPGTTALSATLTPTDSVDYNPVTAYVVFTVSKAQTTTTLAVSTTQTVTGTTATLTATVKPQIGGTPTGTVTYYNGSTVLGSSAVGVPFTTGVLPVGTVSITAVYGGDANFVGSSSSASAVVSVAPTTVQLTSPLSRVFYPASAVSFTVIVPLKNFQLISGTVTLYDGTTVIGTYSLPVGGILVGITPQLSVGTHTLRAVYGGNGQYPPGQSPLVTVTVSAL